MAKGPASLMVGGAGHRLMAGAEIAQPSTAIQRDRKVAHVPRVGEAFAAVPYRLLDKVKEPGAVHAYACARRGSDWTTGALKVPLAQIAAWADVTVNTLTRRFRTLEAAGWMVRTGDGPTTRWSVVPPGSDLHSPDPRSDHLADPTHQTATSDPATHQTGGEHPSKTTGGTRRKSNIGAAPPDPPEGENPVAVDHGKGIALRLPLGDPPEGDQIKARSKPAEPERPPPDEASVEAGLWDSAKGRDLAKVITVIAQVWARDLWTKWAGKRLEPSLGDAEREIRSAVLTYGRTPSGCLQAFRGVPLHPSFQRSLDGGSPLVAARYPLTATGAGRSWAPYDELRDLALTAVAGEAPKGPTLDKILAAWWQARECFLHGDQGQGSYTNDAPAEPYHDGPKWLALDGVPLMAAAWNGKTIPRWQYVPGQPVSYRRITALNAAVIELVAATSAKERLLAQWPGDELVASEVTQWHRDCAAEVRAEMAKCKEMITTATNEGGVDHASGT